MGYSPVPTPELLDVLRTATVADDGLSIQLTRQLDRELYKRVNNALERYGAKWNRKAQAHVFTQDFRPHLEALLAGGRIGAEVKLPPKNPLAYFATPEEVISEMCRRIWPWPRNARFLEPSAGEGAIADFLNARHDTPMDCVELDEGRAETIRKKGYQVVNQDFLTFNPEQPYDYVLMNPPFTVNGDTQVYINHIEHALTCLKPGGDLLAVVPGGFQWLSRKRVVAFREFCQQHAQSPLHQFDPGTFKASGTEIATCLIHITKPQEVVMTEAQPITEKPARKNRSKKAQDAAPAEPVDFKKLAQETREKMAGKKNPPSSEAAAESAQVEQPATHMPAHARFQLGQVVGVKATELVTPADQPGWIFPRGQHLAHWWNGEKAMCGREVADGTNIEANSDPSAYADRTCRKCRAALNKQPLVQAAPEPAGTPAVSDIPAVINDIPEALTVATPVQGVAAPIHTIAQPVLEVAQPEFSVEQPQDSIQAPIPSELPGTPVLLSPANVKPGTLGVVNAQLSICVKSPCNVRMHYDDTKVQEIAASIKADGQLQECVGRWNSDGMLEIVAGETRRRAQVYRQEQGETGLTLRVHVRDLTDAQALRISAQENMARKDMTPLEECEAMLRMQEAGDTIENIQATFGYKTAQPVADRILVAKNLHEESRGLLDSGELSLAQAMVIARAPGKDLQRELANWARRGHAASKLAEVLTSGQFLVKHALFKVEDAGLSIKRDLFDAYEPYFEDKKAALDLQMGAAQARAEKLRAKGKHTFVEVESGTSAYSTLSSSKKYDYTYDHNERKGLILFVHTDTGEVSDETSYRLKASALEKAKKEGTASKDAVAREMPTTAHEAAHLLKAQALRHSLLGHKHLTLVLTVHALIVAGGAHDGRAAHSKSDGWNIPVTTEAVTAKLQFIQTLIADGTKGNLKPDLASLEGKAIHGRKEFAQLFDFLVTLDEPELLDILNALVAARIYEMGWNAKEAPAPVFMRVAGLTGANDYLSSTFNLTDEWLKRYPRHELVALAEEAGLGRALVEDCGTLKEMRARILEHADTLHKEGFVPKFVRFAGADEAKAGKA